MIAARLLDSWTSAHKPSRSPWYDLQPLRLSAVRAPDRRNVRYRGPSSDVRPLPALRRPKQGPGRHRAQGARRRGRAPGDQGLRRLRGPPTGAQPCRAVCEQVRPTVKAWTSVPSCLSACRNAACLATGWRSSFTVMASHQAPCTDGWQAKATQRRPLQGLHLRHCVCPFRLTATYGEPSELPTASRFAASEAPRGTRELIAWFTELGRMRKNPDLKG